MFISILLEYIFLKSSAIFQYLCEHDAYCFILSFLIKYESLKE